MDWAAFFEREVAPILANFAAPVPLAIWAVAGVAVIAGLATFAFVSFPRNLAGFIPIGMVAFGVVMVLQGRNAVETGTVQVREVVVKSMRVEKTVSDSTTTGYKTRLSYILEVELAKAGPLTAEGLTLQDAEGSLRLATSETIYEGISEGDALVGVSLPTAPNYVHFRVLDDGTVVR